MLFVMMGVMTIKLKLLLYKFLLWLFSLKDRAHYLYSSTKGYSVPPNVEQARGKPQTTGRITVEGCTAQFLKLWQFTYPQDSTVWNCFNNRYCRSPKSGNFSSLTVIERKEQYGQCQFPFLWVFLIKTLHLRCNLLWSFDQGQDCIPERLFIIMIQKHYWLLQIWSFWICC